MDNYLDPVSVMSGQFLGDMGGVDFTRDDSAQQEDEPEPGSTEFWRRQSERQQQSLNEAMKKISEQGQQLAQNNMLLQQYMIQQGQQIQALASRPAAPAGQQGGVPGYADYYQQIAGEQQDAGQEAYLTPDQAAQIADQRINATLQGMQQAKTNAQQLFERFTREKPELVPHADLVKQFYTAARASGANEEGGYQYAIATVEGMVKTGRVVVPKNGGTNGFAGTASGGQNVWASPGYGPTSAGTGRRVGPGGLEQISEAEVRKELSDWTKFRRDQLSARMGEDDSVMNRLQTVGKRK